MVKCQMIQMYLPSCNSGATEVEAVTEAAEAGACGGGSKVSHKNAQVTRRPRPIRDVDSPTLPSVGIEITHNEMI